VVGPLQGRYLHTGQHKHKINAHVDIHALSGIRSHDPSVRASEDSSWRRSRGHCRRHGTQSRHQHSAMFIDSGSQSLLYQINKRIHLWTPGLLSTAMILENFYVWNWHARSLAPYVPPFPEFPSINTRFGSHTHHVIRGDRNSLRNVRYWLHISTVDRPRTLNCVSSLRQFRITNRVSHEERSIFCEVRESIILSKKCTCVYMCPLSNGFRDRAISLYSSLVSAPNIVLPSRTWIGMKRQLAVVTVDSDIVGVLWKMSHKCQICWYAVCCPHTSCKVHWW
jgi:hypothetical protein